MLNTDGAGQTRAAGAIIPVSAGGFDVFCATGGHLIVDISGYFTGPSAARSTDGLLVMIEGTRVMDTRIDGNERFWPDGSQGLDTMTMSGQVGAVLEHHDGSAVRLGLRDGVPEPHGEAGGLDGERRP